jgi:homotetrameric cytidine deaminase
VDDSLLASLHARTNRLQDRAHVPFSSSPVAAVVLLGNGDWIPGVRVESASFSLTLPALVNALTTAVALGRMQEVAAVALSRPLRSVEEAYLDDLLGDGSWGGRAADAAVADVAPKDGASQKASAVVWEAPAPHVRALSNAAGLPPPDALGEAVSPAWPSPVRSAADGVAEARRVAQRAHVPSSAFPVGALLEYDDGTLVPGVNVEHPDWTRIVCAERSAIGTALSYGLGGATAARLFLSCLHDPSGTPCGACRQWIAELAPEAALWMDRHNRAPASSTIAALLPGSFQGYALLP